MESKNPKPIIEKTPLNSPLPSRERARVRVNLY
jgi:hypothetical protein